MSETLVVAIVTAVLTALPPTILAIASLIQGRKIIHKADEIHTLTNSNLTKVTADLALATKRIEILEAFIARGATPTT